MVAALNILSARQVSSEQVPKILGQDFYDNYEIVQEARSTLNDKLYRANEKLKFDPTNQELKEKVKALHAEKNDLEKQVKIFEKQLKTYDSALSILTERGLSESANLEK